MPIADLAPTPYSIGGFIEARPAVLWLDTGASLYRLNVPDPASARSSDRQFTSQLQVDAGYRKGPVSVTTRTVLDAHHVTDAWDTGASSYEAFVSLRPSASVSLDVGKKTLKWGKGYIWNPAVFLDRPKDPEDPALPLDGVVMATADYVRSFSGPLQTLGLTAVLLPVYRDVNPHIGRPGTVNTAGKLYLLAFDTDIDVMFQTGGSRPARFGFDLSRNVQSNLEIHAEAAFVPDDVRLVADRTAIPAPVPDRSVTIVVGVRYLTTTNTTIIADLYRNGGGFRQEEMRAFYDLAGAAADAAASGDSTLLQVVRRAAAGYARRTPMQHYVYTRITQPDAFGRLYLTLGGASIVNLDDGSASVLPELSYKLTENLEVRWQGALLLGRRGTEFGEKQADARTEVRVRYYF